jgi:hypothetical protein
MGPTPKCHFVLGLPSGSLEIPKIGIPVTLETHNFVYQPKGEVWSKVLALVESFPMVCGISPAHKEVRVIPNF